MSRPNPRSNSKTRNAENQAWTIRQTMLVAYTAYKPLCEQHGVTDELITEVRENGLANYTPNSVNRRIDAKLITARNAIKPQVERWWKDEFGFAWTSQRAIFAEFLFQTGGTSRAHVTRACNAIRKFMQNKNQFWDISNGQHPFFLMVNGEYGRMPMSRTHEDFEQKLRNTFSGIVKSAVESRLRNERPNSSTRPSNEDRTETTTQEFEPETQDPTQTEADSDLQVEPDEDEDSEVVAEPVQVIQPANSMVTDAAEIKRFIDNMSAMTRDLRDPITGISFDSVGMRPYLDAASLFVEGVPVEIIKANLIRNWPLENKRALWTADGAKFRNGVYVVGADMLERNPWDYDYTEFSAKPNVPGVAYISEKDHRATPLVLTYLHALRRAWLIGIPGGGKTHLVGACAELLSLAKTGGKSTRDFPYVTLSLTRATSPSTFYGKQRIDGTNFLIEYLDAKAEQDAKRVGEILDQCKSAGDTTMSLFEKIIRHGGIIGLDEADRADPNTMQLLNAVIAQRKFVNVTAQTEADLNSDCMFMVMTNTEGTGATRAHNTAEKMDEATIDRFRAARVTIDLDQELAHRKFDEIISAAL